MHVHQVRIHQSANEVPNNGYLSYQVSSYNQSMVEHLEQKFRSDEAIYCPFVSRFMIALYTLESCSWETNQYENKTEIVPNIFLAFDLEGTAVSTQIYRSSNSADLTTDRADAKLRELV
jgi:hypothetical protein